MRCKHDKTHANGTRGSKDARAQVQRKRPCSTKIRPQMHASTHESTAHDTTTKKILKNNKCANQKKMQTLSKARNTHTERDTHSARTQKAKQTHKTCKNKHAQSTKQACIKSTQKQNKHNHAKQIHTKTNMYKERPRYTTFY